VEVDGLATSGDWGEEASESGDGNDSEEGSTKDELVDVDCLIVS